MGHARIERRATVPNKTKTFRRPGARSLGGRPRAPAPGPAALRFSAGVTRAVHPDLDLCRHDSELPRVKLKTPLTFVFVWLAALAFAPSASAGLFGGGKARPPTPAVAMGDNTFSITRQAGSAFSRDVEKLRAEALEDAQRYCADHGKTLKVITFSEDRPMPTLGYVSAKIVFKALDANDPELTAPAAPAAGAAPIASAGSGSSAPAAPVYYAAPANGGFDLYTELNKLDDLRKRGLLTDKEFEKEKKKLLKRSK